MGCSWCCTVGIRHVRRLRHPLTGANQTHCKRTAAVAVVHIPIGKTDAPSVVVVVERRRPKPPNGIKKRFLANCWFAAFRKKGFKLFNGGQAPVRITNVASRPGIGVKSFYRIVKSESAVFALLFPHQSGFCVGDGAIAMIHITQIRQRFGMGR